MEIRRFSPDLKTKIPGGHTGLYGVPIQFDRPPGISSEEKEELARRVNGLPILLNRPLVVVAIYLEPHGQMDEHAADEPVLFLVTGGRGFVRIGGPAGETRELSPGMAVLWPAKLDHKIWTEDEPMDGILIHGPAERDSRRE